MAWDDLSDDELIARLTQRAERRGAFWFTDPESIAQLVYYRDDPVVAETITELLEEL